MSNHLVKERRKVIKYEDYLKTLETGLTFKMYAMELEKRLLDKELLKGEDLKEIFELCEETAQRKIEERRKK